MPEEPTAAATVVLVRDATGGGIEVLLVRRGDVGAFGGVWAFPGGRVDPGDVDPDRPDDELEAARRAAVRETEEEVGLVLDKAQFVPLSHWTPPPESPRRFTTWFFLAPAPQGDVVVDGTEIADHRWIAPADALRLHVDHAAQALGRLVDRRRAAGRRARALRHPDDPARRRHGRHVGGRRRLRRRRPRAGLPRPQPPLDGPRAVAVRTGSLTDSSATAGIRKTGGHVDRDHR
jgi:8-oxo-dGTP pyrophosphatase MutT (NUDIX family)